MNTRILIAALVLIGIATSVLAATDAVVVRGGDLRIREVGSGLVFPNGSIQYTATVEGPPGPQGTTGPANNLNIGSVTTGSQAGATITGIAPQQTLNLTLPIGPKGDTGPQGPAGIGGPLGVYDGNGLLLGVFLGIEPGGGTSASVTFLANDNIYRVGPEGYYINSVYNSYFSQADCKGIIYVADDDIMSPLFFPQFVFALTYPTQVGTQLYKKLAESPKIITYASLQNGNTCTNTVGTIMATPTVQAGTIPEPPPLPITIR